MAPDIDRRSLIAGIGGLGAVATGGYAWTRYATRDHLQFRPLEGVNNTDEPVELVVTALSDGTGEYERTDDLEPGADAKSLAGPWIKHADAYSLRARTADAELVLENREIVDRLDDAGWGSDCAHVRIVVTEDGDLESRVRPSEYC